MYAVLGETEFELITYFDGMDLQFGANYAEHALIGRKPRLQWVGDKLDEFQLQLVFHSSFCDPEKELLKLRQMVQSAEAHQFVLGNGDYKGWFVLVDATASSKQTDKTGSLIALEATATLREYVEPRVLETRRAQAKKAAKKKRTAAAKKSSTEKPVVDARDGFAKNGSRAPTKGD
jgi:phage protein U